MTLEEGHACLGARPVPTNSARFGESTTKVLHCQAPISLSAQGLAGETLERNSIIELRIRRYCQSDRLIINHDEADIILKALAFDNTAQLV